MVIPNNSFAKTICSICYEDLKPNVEDLQSISICGHVFHELCLQQWFEYCTNSKKQTCPVCKQGCSNKNACRLYFQSVGDIVLSQSQIPVDKIDVGESPEALQWEVKRLETKVAGLTSAVEQHQKEAQHLTDELQLCKEQLSREVTLKEELERQKSSILSRLQATSSDLGKSSLECVRLQERNISLAKELAALKLVSDCNLEEDQIMKLATVGNEANKQDAIDVLKKSLVIRNKSYRELMMKCNSLGRGEARALRKYEKLKEKMAKLKARNQELEAYIEAKDNDMLRNLKAHKKKRSADSLSPVATKSTNPSSAFNCSARDEKGCHPPLVINLDGDGNKNSCEVKQTSKKDSTLSKLKGDNGAFERKEVINFGSFIDIEDEVQKSKTVNICSITHNSTEGFHDKCGSLSPTDSEAREASLYRPNEPFGLSGLAGCNNDLRDNCNFTKDSPGLLLKDIKQVQPSLQKKAESSSPVPLDPGDRSFAGGLQGPDGANMYLGKWCKRVPSKALGQGGSTCGSSKVADGLIAVGADGRGGKVKILRSANQINKESNVSTKKLKPGPKISSLQPRGHLQIEHFFGKAQH